MESIIEGYVYRSDEYLCQAYLIEMVDINDGLSVDLKIYTFQNYLSDEYQTGDIYQEERLLFSEDTTCEISVGYKYFVIDTPPTQCYYEGIDGMSYFKSWVECQKFAIEKAISLGNIRTQ